MSKSTIPGLRGAIRRTDPDERDKCQLRDVVATIGSSSSHEAREHAVADLLRAIDAYRHNFLHSDGDLLRRGNLAGDRRALANVVASLITSLHAIDQLQGAPEAIRLLSRRTRKPLGAVERTLQDLLMAAQGASHEALWREQQPDDAAAAVLACSVAITLASTLGIKVTMTTDRVSSGARGGAAYARLLRATLEVAGAKPPENLRPLMIRGRSLGSCLE